MGKIIKRTDLRATLLSIEVGETMRIVPPDAKAGNVRGMAFKLNREGYDFQCTERGMDFGIDVTRNA